MPPFFSIVVPAYNSGATLNACLDSIISQSFGDVEIVVVDDGSRDDTRDIAEKYASRDSRLRVHANGVNRNLFDTRITGFRLASGRYVAVCDADDELPPGAMAAFAGAVASRGGPDVVHGRALELGGGRDGRPLYNCDPFRVVTGADFVRSLLSIGRGWNVWGKAFRTELVHRRIGELPGRTGWFMLEDLLFCVWFGQAAKTYAGIGDFVYRYRYPSGPPPAEKLLKNSTDQLEVMGWLARNADKLELDSVAVAALYRLFRRLLALDIRRHGDGERELLMRKAAVELGERFSRGVAEAPFSERSYLLPGYHLDYLRRHGLHEYVCRLRTLFAAVPRLGCMGVVRKLLGGRR